MRWCRNGQRSGHALARGVPMTTILAEMYGKAEGCSGGRGGSMHLFDAVTNFYSGNAIVGGGLPFTVGLAHADRMQGTYAVTACFFGKGAVAEGEFHETMNLAALWLLPVPFVSENNGDAMGSALARTESTTDIYQKAADYGIAAQQIDGMDVVAVEAATREALRDIRTNGKPVFLDCRTYRFRAHSIFDAQLYRDKAEIEDWRTRGPVVHFLGWLLENHPIHYEDVVEITRRVDAEIADAVVFAEVGTWEPVERLTHHVLGPPARAAGRACPSDDGGATYREAVMEGQRGDVVAVVETQKGAIEIECFEDGIVQDLRADLGARLTVGAPLALILAPGEATPEASQEPAAPAGAEPEPAAAARVPKPAAAASPAGPAAVNEPAAASAGALAELVPSPEPSDAAPAARPGPALRTAPTPRSRPPRGCGRANWAWTWARSAAPGPVARS
ncbi:thiamine pyrophosphate-dependent enzyme [Meridianimarinicoccus sp. RP-17]|uniref:thiamine pyrophosphate-dependent enzyme n=1 Tax=Meridianimarinicoccus zhengii TaxID=2056810 RepID=UPI0022A7235D|nr:thiamine pyrophosphate-dependent enzyme [Phycocomes zhengii]